MYNSICFLSCIPKSCWAFRTDSVFTQHYELMRVSYIKNVSESVLINTYMILGITETIPEVTRNIIKLYSSPLKLNTIHKCFSVPIKGRSRCYASLHCKEYGHRERGTFTTQIIHV